MAQRGGRAATAATAAAAASAAPTGPGLRVAFVHPDLGIGGAERLVVDAAVGLQRLGHNVTMWTAHCSPTHAFEETQNGTLRVRVRGDFLPQTLAGRLRVVCATLRMIWLSLWLLVFGGAYDVIVVDVLPTTIPLLRLRGARVLYYCHFPDVMLATRDSALRRAYRAPFDWLEAATTRCAHRVMVNSRFTAGVFRQAFPSIRTAPRVLYPPINVSAFDAPSSSGGGGSSDLPAELQAALAADGDDAIFFLSINRYEQKKDIALGVRAYALLCSRLAAAAASTQRRPQVHFVHAGGYDPLLAENQRVFGELQRLAAQLGGVQGRVHLLRSISAEQKLALLRRCAAVVYTPRNEHFGIVPVEAMYVGKPVLALASGGPLESVLHGRTGFLCEPEPDRAEQSFAAAMLRLIDDPAEAAAMGVAAREHVKKNFTLEAFARELDQCCRG